VLFACALQLNGKKDKDKSLEKRNINCDDIVQDVCKLAAVNNVPSFKYFDGCNDCQCITGVEEEGTCNTTNTCADSVESKDQKYCYKVNKRIHKAIRKANKKSKYGNKYSKNGSGATGEKGKKGFKSYCNKKVNCADVIKPESFCNDSHSEFKFFDGCNECVCTGGKTWECTTNKTCPAPATKDPRSTGKCKKLLKRIEEDLKNAKSIEVECFANKTTICEDYPTGSYFDGCRTCTCDESGAEQCNYEICFFYGTQRQYKKFCKANAKIYKTEEDWEARGDTTKKSEKDDKDDD